MKEIQEFIKKHIETIKPLEKKGHFAYWRASISGEDKDFKEYEEISKELSKIYNNKEEFEKIKNWLSKNIENQVLKRHLEVIHNEYLSSQGSLDLLNEIISKETKTEQKFNTFRARVDGKELTDNQIKDILKTEKDSEKLKAVWEASKKQGEIVEKDLIEIVKLRNKLAKEIGFDNYYIMSLEASEQKQEDLIPLFEELAKNLEEPFKEMKKEINSALSKKYGVPEEELKPWHHQDLFFQESPQIHKVDLDKFYLDHDVVKIAEDFYNSIGFSVKEVLENSDLYEKPKKNQHAYCTNMDREGDVRILQNVKNDEHWMGTTLHELGHAVYDIRVDPNLPFMLRDSAHIFTTEAVAMLFGRLSKNTAFIKKYCKIDEKEISAVSKEILEMSRMRQLVFSRWVQVMFNFERKLYEDPDQDLNKLWWDLVRKYQLIQFSRNKPDWASKIHFVIAPVYYHNYMLGELLASQIHSHIVKNILKVNSLKNVDYSENKEIGEFLTKNIFKVGKKYKWDEMIKRALGEELSPEYFSKEFAKKT